METARQNRVRVQASRERRGPAPRFTDDDLVHGFRRRAADESPHPTGNEIAAPVGVEDLPLAPRGRPVPDADRLEGGSPDVRPSMEAHLREIGEREAEIQERLLEIEVSLTAIGASGLPYAQRNPHRFQSPLDARRLRAEQEELRRERDALVAERRLLR